MKTLKEVCDKTLQPSNENKLVHFYASNEGYKPIDPPVFANDFRCPFCGNDSYYLPMLNKEQRIWLCSRICGPSKLPKCEGGGYIATPPKRCVPWASWCEINGLGDLLHDIRFEKIEQSKGKIAYLLKFALNPCGIIVMQGDKGLGKTYAAIGCCEMYTRKRSSCLFFTQRQLLDRWLDHFKAPTNFINQVIVVELLVVDDFGIGSVSPDFMAFFMDVINARMQWSNRGTIITTNLDDQMLGKFCGNALMDRLNTGQKFIFEGKTRRIPKPL